MHIVAVAWIFVVVLMAAAEAGSTQGTLLGAIFTLLLYGALPLTVVLYVMGAPSRRRARRAAERKSDADASGAAQGDGGGLPTGAPVAAEGKEP